MKKIYLLLLSLVLILPAVAKERVAVFDPSGTAIDEGSRIAVREIISSTIVNSGKYNIVERSMLEKVMQEQSFSNSGAVDDSQATEIGKLAGASKVIISVLTKAGNRNMLSVKMIDVMTASVERQKVQMINPNELFNIIEPMTLNLIGGSNSGSGVEISDAPSSSSSNSISNTSGPIPGKNELVFYLPAGYQPEKEEDKNQPIEVKFNKVLIGTGTIGEGFSFRVPAPQPGQKAVLRIGKQKYKLNTQMYNYFEFSVHAISLESALAAFSAVGGAIRQTSNMITLGLGAITPYQINLKTQKMIK